MKTILITTDFSANSKSAIRFAVQMSSQMACKFVFYSVLETTAPTSWPKIEVQRFLDSELSKGQKQLQNFVEKTFKQLKVSHIRYQCEVQIGNNISGMIVEYAQKIKADFICMSTRGAGMFQKIMGTHASALVNSSSIPVIVVPKNYRFRNIQKIGYSSDVESIDAELPTVLSLAKLFGVPTEIYHFNMLTAKANKAKQAELNTRYQEGNSLFYCLTQKVEDTLVENIQRVIRTKKPSVLVMFSKFKPNWIERLFLASFTAGMTFDLNIPMISYRKK